jgi:hypothetical protein
MDHEVGQEKQHSIWRDQMTSSVLVHMDQRLTWLKQVKVKIIKPKLKLGHTFWMLGLKSPLSLDNEILLHNKDLQYKK